jgi:hypothetical protein
VRDPSKRVVITGIGLCSVFGNDPDKFYDRYGDCPGVIAGTLGEANDLFPSAQPKPCPGSQSTQQLQLQQSSSSSSCSYWPDVAVVLQALTASAGFTMQAACW